MQDIFPDVHSFSVTNLKYMRYFYEMYPNMENRQQVVDELQEDAIFHIPWGHHVAIINACRNDADKALFYVRKTLENNWSRAVLLNFLDTDLFERQGKALTNFHHFLPEPQSELAQSITKDPYNFDFLTIRENYVLRLACLFARAWIGWKQNTLLKVQASPLAYQVISFPVCCRRNLKAACQQLKKSKQS